MFLVARGLRPRAGAPLGSGAIPILVPACTGTRFCRYPAVTSRHAIHADTTRTMSRPRLFLFSGRLLPAFTLRIGALSAALLHQIVKIARRRLLAGARKLLLLRADICLAAFKCCKPISWRSLKDKLLITASAKGAAWICARDARLFRERNQWTPAAAGKRDQLVLSSRTF